MKLEEYQMKLDWHVGQVKKAKHDLKNAQEALDFLVRNTGQRLFPDVPVPLLVQPEPAGFMVEGWHDNKLLAKAFDFNFEKIKQSAAKFAQHYETVHTIPLYAKPSKQGEA